MPTPKLPDSLDSLGRALERLREGLELTEASPLAIDGTIQRFEFVVQKAYQAGWLHAFLLRRFARDDGQSR